MSGKKKNFTEDERNLLIQIGKSFKDVIENKKTDNANVQIKKHAWNEIAKIFNSSNIISETATGEQLKRLWQNIKTRQKEALTKERQHRLATGGGGPCPDAEANPELADIVPVLLVEIKDGFDADSTPIVKIEETSSISPPRNDSPLPKIDNVRNGEEMYYPNHYQPQPQFPENNPNNEEPFLLNTAQYSKIEKKLRSQIFLQEHLKRMKKMDIENEMKSKLLQEQLKFVKEENELKKKILEAQLREARAKADLAEAAKSYKFP